MKALSLYHVLSFGQFHQGNPDVIALAREIGRTPGAVAMKLCNLASLDSHHKARGVAGLSKASELDREVWEETYGNWDTLARNMLPSVEREPKEQELVLPPGPTVVERLVKARRGQQFFRRAVLSAYDFKCCVTGIDHVDLLRASHIVPWAESEEHRLNPSNGLCLNSLHDAAFDSNLLTIDHELRVALSPRLAQSMPKDAFEAHFGRYLGKKIRPPDRFAPSLEFLSKHRQRCLEG